VEVVENEFREAAASDHAKPGDFNSLGYYYLERGDVQNAIEIFRINIENFPDDGDLYDSLGEAYVAGGDKANATIYLKKAIEMNPGNQHAKQLLNRL
jgi:tetratricopeptide (TPR) repeat protein